MALYIDKFKEEDGWYKDVDGCSYESDKDFISGYYFDLCGCIHDVWVPVIISCFEYCESENKNFENFVNEVFNGNEGSAYLVLNTLDKKEYIEHGFAIRYPWLSGLGKQLLHDMKIIYQNG
jgi:hypothetical protein